MARSKQVYAVLGLLCIDEDFRNDFFEDPHQAANRLVGSLTPDELNQINRIGGIGMSGDRVQYVDRTKGAMRAVQSALGCPQFPCPEKDPFDA